MAHAFNDWNVVPEHSVRITAALTGRVPLQRYFHPGGHGGAPPLPMMNKWFTRFLHGVENGVEKEPKAWVVREAATAPPAPEGGGRGRGRGATPPPTAYADYPHPDASMVTLHPAAGGAARGGLVTTGPATGRETLTDNVEFAGPALALAEQSPHRLLYATAELQAPVHVSGIPQVTIRMASNRPAANLTVWLVQLPWVEGPISTNNLITRGWADPQNYASLTRGGNYASRTPGTPLAPGAFVSMTFDL
jgi:X-Pro dipeptidyl-peptidase